MVGGLSDPDTQGEECFLRDEAKSNAGKEKSTSRIQANSPGGVHPKIKLSSHPR
jgi:hypothetical protein